MVPSDVRRSRLCSRLVMRLITGATCCMTRRWMTGWAKARRRKSSGAISATRQSCSARMRTPSEPPVSVAIAPIQVGALWRLTGSEVPASSRIAGLGVALEQQLQTRASPRPARR